MGYLKSELTDVLCSLDFGSSVAELDTLLEAARVETSVFTDLYKDRVDLIPGTKGSGKSALYRIFVEFLPDSLYATRKVVVAHGVHAHGDNVFHAFRKEFDGLSEEDFVNFWCVYLVSLAHEHFLKNRKYSTELKKAKAEIEGFRQACFAARIPEIEAKKTLRGVLSWALSAIQQYRPRVVYRPKEEDFTLELFGEPPASANAVNSPEEPLALPRYINEIKEDLEKVLSKANLSLWMMVDRLDEIFPRRSETETRALRALLRTLKIFTSPRIRVKVFLRDDILEQVTSGGEGFTALTHVTARQADSLRWSNDQILTLITNRLCASGQLCGLVGIDEEQMKASREYRRDVFYRVFPATVHAGSRQSETLRWIYTHTADGRGVVTPRDVIELLTRAKQYQQNECDADPTGSLEHVIGPAALRYGLRELSLKKRTTLLEAEFPHFSEHIKRFENGKTEYSEQALKKKLGAKWNSIVEDLAGIGLFEVTRRSGQRAYKIPFVYRDGLSLTQGRAD